MFEIYTDKRGELRWRFKAANGRVLFACTEGYKNRADLDNCLAAAQGSTICLVRDITRKKQ
jgi:uncharacterized protein YegP (UPF0339 family)